MAARPSASNTMRFIAPPMILACTAGGKGFQQLA
jgi:hypothetical protein